MPLIHFLSTKSFSPRIIHYATASLFFDHSLRSLFAFDRFAPLFSAPFSHSTRHDERRAWALLQKNTGPRQRSSFFFSSQRNFFLDSCKNSFTGGRGSHLSSKILRAEKRRTLTEASVLLCVCKFLFSLVSSWFVFFSHPQVLNKTAREETSREIFSSRFSTNLGDSTQPLALLSCLV